MGCPPYERSDARVVCSADPPADALTFEPEPGETATAGDGEGGGRDADIRTAARHGLGPGVYAVAIRSSSAGTDTVYVATGPAVVALRDP